MCLGISFRLAYFTNQSMLSRKRKWTDYILSSNSYHIIFPATEVRPLGKHTFRYMYYICLTIFFMKSPFEVIRQNVCISTISSVVKDGNMLGLANVSLWRWWYRSFFGFTFLNILYFFKYFCSNIFHRRSLCTFYYDDDLFSTHCGKYQTYCQFQYIPIVVTNKYTALAKIRHN